MNNEFIFIPNLDLDLEKIKNIVIKNIDNRIGGLATHQRRVADESYLLQVRNRYTFLSNIYNIYQLIHNIYNIYNIYQLIHNNTQYITVFRIHNTTKHINTQ